MRKRILLAIIGVIICSLIIGGIYFYYDYIVSTNVNDVYLIFKQNDTLEGVAKKLQDKNIIKSQATFIYFAKVMGLKKDVENGDFIIRPKTNIMDIITKFKGGKSDFTVITIPEGYTLYQIASKLEQNNLLKKEDILNEKINDVKTNTLILSKIDVYYDLEGYLFPDTYYIPTGATKDEIIDLMMNEFKNVFSDRYQAQAKKMGLDVNQVITIASLIEKETAKDSERSEIAGVIYNRLKKGIPLQVDAAVIYAKTKGQKNIEKVYYNTLKFKSEYNTYLHKELPPGPIASPGKASIEAALYPQKNDYLYYVASKSGHIFSKTYGEHLKNVKKYIK